jgi:hypothetical protein
MNAVEDIAIWVTKQTGHVEQYRRPDQTMVGYRDAKGICPAVGAAMSGLPLRLAPHCPEFLLSSPQVPMEA